MPKMTRLEQMIDYPHDVIEGFNARKVHARAISKQRSQARRLRDQEQTDALLEHSFTYSDTYKG